ncbi:MAG: hypothetical protein AB7F86_09715 [Bdellovibrionales bacterium]
MKPIKGLLKDRFVSRYEVISHAQVLLDPAHFFNNSLVHKGLQNVAKLPNDSGPRLGVVDWGQIRSNWYY